MSSQSFSARRSSWPFVGRFAEVEDLVHRFEHVRRGQLPAGVVIAGEAGVGKSALANRFLEQLGSRWEVRRFTASPAAQTIAFGVFGRSTAGLGPDTFTQAERLAERLVEVPPGKRAVVFVDDVHFVDDASAFVLQQVAQRGGALLFTYREGSPLPESVGALWRGGTVARLDLEPMLVKDATTLLETLLGGVVETASIRRMWDITQGNALYLRELIEGERAAGRLKQERGVWSWAGEPALSPNLRDLVSSRMGRVTEPDLTIVDALAVAEPLPVSVLAELASSDAVESAETQRLIAVSADSGELIATLAHPLFGEVRRDTAGTVRLRRIRGSVMNALATYSKDPSIRLQIAALSLDADQPLDAELLIEGARIALRHFDFPLATKLADAANALTASTAIRLAHASILVSLFRGAEAEALLAGLDLEPSDDLFAHAIALRAINLSGGLGKVDVGVELLDAAIARFGDDVPPALTGARAGMRAAQGELATALEEATAAQQADGIPPYIAMMMAATRTLSAGILGRIEEMEAAADFAFDLAAREPEASQLRFYVGSLAISGYMAAGYLDRVDATASRLDDEAALVPPGVADAPATVLLGMRSSAHGQTALAIRRLSEALIQPTARGMAPRSLVCLAQMHAVRGEAAQARQFFQMIKTVLPPQLRFMRGVLGVAEIWVLTSEGLVAEAIGRAYEVAAEAAELGDRAHEVLALQAATQLGDPNAAERLTELAATAEGPRAEVAAGYARALANKSAQDLEDASDAFMKLGDAIASIDAASQASVLYQRAGDHAKANRLAAYAQRLAAECEVRTPAFQQCRLPDLSSREREVAMLVAEGHTTKDIAARLGLSTRTVEGHISRALQKTGSSTRLDLAALFRRS